MNLRLLARVLYLALATAAGFGFSQAAVGTPLPHVATGAGVDESRVQKIYYVDAANAEAADDEKHGTLEEPFATLAQACRAAADDKDRGVGVKIILAAGTYREAAEIRPPPGDRPDTAAPLVIEAAEREQAVIDGADVEGWTASTWQTDAAGRWTHPWPFPRAVPAGRNLGASTGAAAAGEPYPRGGLLFINNNALRQVATAAELAPGTFWLPVARPVHTPTGSAARRHSSAIASSPEAAGAPSDGGVVVQTPLETDRAGAVIQAGRRDHGFVIRDRRNVVVRGLLFQHAANPENKGGADAITAGLVLTGCANVLVEDVLCQWNDGTGLVITGRPEAPGTADITLRRVRLLHNGDSGLYAARLRNVLVEDSEVSFNNFRGEWAGGTDPGGQAGAKLVSVQGATWRRPRAEGNAGRGLWLAGDCADVSIEDGVIRNNLVSGLLIADNPGPVRVRRSEITGNRMPPASKGNATFPAGLAMVATADVTLESSIIAGNGGSQISLWNAADAGDAKNSAAGNMPRERSTGHTYHHNVICGFDGTQMLSNLPAPDRAGHSSVSDYYVTLTANDNLFWNAAVEGVFRSSEHADSRRPGQDFAAWKAQLFAWANPAGTGPGERQPEATSLWQDPLFVDGPGGDFRLRTGSPASDWDLPADERASE